MWHRGVLKWFKCKRLFNSQNRSVVTYNLRHFFQNLDFHIAVQWRSVWLGKATRTWPRSWPNHLLSKILNSSVIDLYKIGAYPQRIALRFSYVTDSYRTFNKDVHLIWTLLKNLPFHEGLAGWVDSKSKYCNRIYLFLWNTRDYMISLRQCDYYSFTVDGKLVLLPCYKILVFQTNWPFLVAGDYLKRLNIIVEPLLLSSFQLLQCSPATEETKNIGYV